MQDVVPAVGIGHGCSNLNRATSADEAAAAVPLNVSFTATPSGKYTPSSAHSEDAAKNNATGNKLFVPIGPLPEFLLLF